MKIDATPRHPMRCAPVDEPSINAMAVIVASMSPHDLALLMLQLSGNIRRGEVVDGAELVAVLRHADSFLRYERK